MVKFAQVVLGPAGSGKSTYCAKLQQYCNDKHRSLHVINLDPAAEDFKYNVTVDIRQLISVNDVGQELQLGPNGALVYCMEFLLNNIEWLEEQLDVFIDNDYIIFDLPGQIELYTHFPFMKDLLVKLHGWDFRVQALYFLDSQFMSDGAKFFGGCVTALSAMIQLEVPHINVMSKMDLATEADKQRLEEFTYPEISLLVKELSYSTTPKYDSLNNAMANLLDEYNMISFIPLDLSQEDSMADLLVTIDVALQYDDEVDHHLEVPDMDDDEENNDDASEED